MKKQILFFSLTLGISISNAQEVSDAIRYSQNNATGTARFRAMSGAFGALGGDLSALNVNPAGSVVFANNQIAASLNNDYNSNESQYFRNKTDSDKNSFDINQAGGVFVFENNNSDWKKFSLALNYEKSANFDNSIFSAGSSNNSIDQYFLNYANSNNGVPLNFIEVDVNLNETITSVFDYLSSNLPLQSAPNIFPFQAQQAFLGYQAFILEPVNFLPNNQFYISNIPAGGNYNQTNSIETLGYNGKLTANISGQYQDKLMLGLNLNSHFADYRRVSRFTEVNSNNTSTTNLIKSIGFNNDLYTYGSGFSFQLGAIFKPINQIRLGLAYQSPTWYNLNDELRQSITAVTGNNSENFPRDIVDPNVIVIYEPYKLTTPAKLTSSFAYVIGKRGLISFDYSVRNFSGTTFRPKKDLFFSSLNNNIDANARQSASEYNVGGEYKIKQFSLRGGYHFEQSPYKNSETLGNLVGYSGGLGYNFGSTKLDLAYTTSKRDYNQSFFAQSPLNTARINNTNTNVVVTLSFEL